MMPQSRPNQWIGILFCMALMGGTRAALAWGPHPQITQAALDAMGPQDALVVTLGADAKKLPQYSIMPDQRQSLVVRADEVFYADDYLLFPAAPRHIGHMIPDVRQTYVPYFRRSIQAIRTETPLNAARWLGSLIHFVEDTGAPPHALPITGETHKRMENWVDAKKIIIADYKPRLLGATESEAEAGLLARIEGLIAFSVQRAQRCRADVDAGNREAVEPVVLESALEAARVIADMLHTIGIVAKQEAKGISITGQVAVSPGKEKIDRVSAKIVLLDTPYSTLAAADGSFRFDHLPPARYKLAVLGPRGLSYTTEVQPSLDSAGSRSDVPASKTAGLVRNSALAICWSSPGEPDAWYPSRSADKPAKPGWQSEWLPLKKGQKYRLAVDWKDTSGKSRIVIRTRSGQSSDVKPTLSDPVLPGCAFEYTAPAEGDPYLQIFVQTPGKLTDAVKTVDVAPAD